MPGSTVLYSGNGPTRTRHGYYTGQNINATKSSRTAITSGTSVSGGKIGVGDVLIRDPFGHDKGVGMDFTQPATSYLHEQAVVVIQTLEPKARGADTPRDAVGTACYPQEFIGVEAKEGVLARTNANMYTGYTLLGLTNGSTALTAVSTNSGLGAGGVSVGALTDSSGGAVGTTLAAQTLATALTHAVGTADGTVDDVGGAFNQTTLNNNFKELTTAQASNRAQLSVLRDTVASLAAAVNNLFLFVTRGKGVCLGSVEGTGVAIGTQVDTSGTAGNRFVRFAGSQANNI